MDQARILFLADTHLGIDKPRRPRIRRRRRGDDFAANYARALEPAFANQVDLVVHGGDLLYRSKVPPSLVSQALAPLLKLADRGLPVLLVPGNHERSRIPYPLLARHPRLLLFDRPRTHLVQVGGLKVALGGFPCVRHIREPFRAQLKETGLEHAPADIRLLCLHQALAGARVGPHQFTFTSGRDVIRGRELPPWVAAVLSGHIHRHQVLTHDLDRRTLPSPVFYPGSIERTSFAEKDEPKGYLLMAFIPDGTGAGRILDWTFRDLPARPMVQLELDPTDLDGPALQRRLLSLLKRQSAQAIVQIRLSRPAQAEARQVLRAAHLRAISPDSMNLTISWPKSPAHARA